MPKSNYSTGGTMSGSVGNPEYRHDPMHKGKNRQTRGEKDIGHATGHGSRNRQTPSNYYVQDGAHKMQKCMAYRMRSNKASGRSSAQFPGSRKPAGSGKSMTGRSY